jgi:hypothetical protein
MANTDLSLNLDIASSTGNDISTILGNLNNKYYDLLNEYQTLQDDMKNIQSRSKQISLAIRETKLAISRLQEVQSNFNSSNNSNNSNSSTTKPESSNNPSVLPTNINFGNLKVINHIKSGGKSKNVDLLEHNIIKKRYDRKNLEHVKAYHREVNILKYLEKCPFVPKILHLVPEKYIIYMTYCGICPEEDRNSLHKISQLAKKLYDDYNVYRVEGDQMTFKINTNNACWDGENYYLIDFGSPNWNIKGKILPN